MATNIPRAFPYVFSRAFALSWLSHSESLIFFIHGYLPTNSGTRRLTIFLNPS